MNSFSFGNKSHYIKKKLKQTNASKSGPSAKSMKAVQMEPERLYGGNDF